MLGALNCALEFTFYVLTSSPLKEDGDGVGFVNMSKERYDQVKINRKNQKKNTVITYDSVAYYPYYSY